MNTTYRSYFDKAELALVAYSNFSLVPRIQNGTLDPAEIKKALIKLKRFPFFEKESGFSLAEDEKFLERFEELDQYTADPIFNGFSATIFREKATGKTYFVNRGTNEIVDAVVTDRILALGGKTHAFDLLKVSVDIAANNDFLEVA